MHGQIHHLFIRYIMIARLFNISFDFLYTINAVLIFIADDFLKFSIITLNFFSRKNPLGKEF